MSGLDELKKELGNWTLDSDRKLLNELENCTGNMLNGITEMISMVKELDQNTEDCYIRLRHAVNWMSSLSSTKFIENKIQPALQTPQTAEETPQTHVKEMNRVEKNRKAIEIALTDLNIRDLKPDEQMTVTDLEDAENRTMMVGGAYVTPQLRGKLPFLIGSKEFYQTKYLGIELGESGNRLTEDALKGLKKEGEEAKQEDHEAAGASTALIGAMDEIKEEPRSNFSSQVIADSALKSYPAKSSLFEMEGEDTSTPLPVPPEIDIPLPPPDLSVPEPPPFDFDLPPSDIPAESSPPIAPTPPEIPLTIPEARKTEIKPSKNLFDEDVGRNFSTILEKKAPPKETKKVDLQAKMDKLFGDDEEEEKPQKKSGLDLLSIYSSGNTGNLFGDSEKKETKAEPQKKEISKHLSKFLDDDDDSDFSFQPSGSGSSKPSLFGD